MELQEVQSQTTSDRHTDAITKSQTPQSKTYTTTVNIESLQPYTSSITSTQKHYGRSEDPHLRLRSHLTL